MSPHTLPPDWPHRQASQFLEVAGQRWHLQRMGEGQPLLLLHGTGASSHSWSGLLDLLLGRFDCLAPDLPGHGFSAAADSDGMTLPGMARLTAELLQSLDVQPRWVAGHSAGAAVLARMCLDGHIHPDALLSINGALLALPGMTGWFFSSSARMLAAIPSLPAWVSSLGSRRVFTERLLRTTGSSIPVASVDCYRHLVSTPSHVSGALQMMANWDLDSLQRDLHGLQQTVHLVACQQDRTVPPQQSARLQRLLPDATVHALPGLGHLGHEENPGEFVALLESLSTH